SGLGDLYVLHDKPYIWAQPHYVGTKISLHSGMGPYMGVVFHGAPRCAPGDRCPSTCASTASAWSSQKVISIDWYIAIAVANAARACSRWPVMAYSVPRPRW